LFGRAVHRKFIRLLPARVFLRKRRVIGSGASCTRGSGDHGTHNEASDALGERLAGEELFSKKPVRCSPISRKPVRSVLSRVSMETMSFPFFSKRSRHAITSREQFTPESASRIDWPRFVLKTEHGTQPAAQGTVVTHRYELIRPIVGFCKTDRKVLTIPAGETASLGLSKATVGACDAIWNDSPCSDLASVGF
jgi:hypothetical protein